jgi:hypothetical protein
MACGCILVATACGRRSRTPFPSELAEQLAKDPGPGIRTNKVSARDLQCEGDAIAPTRKTIDYRGGKIGVGENRLEIAEGVIPKGHEYTFYFGQHRIGVVFISVQGDAGVPVAYNPPVDPRKSAFTLKVDYDHCKDKGRATALHRWDDATYVLAGKVHRHAVTAYLEHPSTYAVAAPGYAPHRRR